MQIAHYERSLGSLTDEQRRANYEKGLGSLTDEQRRANGLLGYEKGLALLTEEERWANYEKGLALLTYEQHRANGSLGYKKSLGLLTKEQRRANYVKSLGSLTVEERQALNKRYCPPPTITKDGMHDLALDDVVVQANYGTGIVMSVQKPCKNYLARAMVEFKDKQVGSKRVTINSLSCKGQQCQFAFVWNALDGQWMGMYQKLVAYKKQYMSTKVPRRGTTNQLGKWVATQRGLYKKNKLLDKRTELLNFINFV